MGLTDAVARAGSRSGRTCWSVEAPGAFRERVALERALDAARVVRSPDSVADADVLAVVGEPGPGLREVVEHTWHQMSEPRARVGRDDGGRTSRRRWPRPGTVLLDDRAAARRGPSRRLTPGGLAARPSPTT